MLIKILVPILVLTQLAFAESAQEDAKQAIPGYVTDEDRGAAAEVSVVYTKPNCDAFFDSEGVIGSFGKQVIKSVEENPEAYFNLVPKDFIGNQGRKLCPNYENMTISQKRLFWVWMFRSLGHTESSCRAAPPVTIKAADRKNKDPSRYADRGMFQLNYARCGTIDLDQGENSIDCATKVLANEILKRGKLTAPQTNAESTYWGPLRTDSQNSKRSKASIRNSQRTQETISRFKFCQATASKQDEEREEDKDDDEVTVEVDIVKTKTIFPPRIEGGKIIPGKSEVIKLGTKTVPVEK